MANVIPENSIYVGVELTALAKLQPITNNDIVYLQINQTTLGEFMAMGQTVIYADRKNKLHEAALYGQPDKLVQADAQAIVYPLRAFTNNLIAGSEKLWMAQYFDALAHQQLRELEIKNLLADIHGFHTDTKANRAKIDQNTQQVRDSK